MPLQLTGVLQKQGGAGGIVWQERYFVLSGISLSWYLHSTDFNQNSAPRNSLLLTNVTELTREGVTDLCLKGPHLNRTYHLRARTNADRESWFNALDAARKAGEQPPEPSSEPANIEVVKAVPSVEKPSDLSELAVIHSYWLQRFSSVKNWMGELFDNATSYPAWMLSLADVVNALPLQELQQSAECDEAQTKALLARCVDANKALITWRSKAFGGGPPSSSACELDIILADRLAITTTTDATGWITFHRHNIELHHHPALNQRTESPAQAQERERQKTLQERLQLVEGEFSKAHNSRFADLPVRVIALRSVLADHGIMEETPLQELFAGHENWGHSLLSNFCTAVVPVSVLLGLGERFCMYSYRWEGEQAGSANGRQVSIPANYGCFLEYLVEARLIGWIDFAAHRGNAEELGMVVRVMGYLYAVLPVVPQFLLGSKEQQTEALGRGWIYQETAFSFLSPKVTQAYVARLLANLNDVDNIEQLLALAARRMRLVPVVELLQAALSAANKTEVLPALADLPIRFAQSGEASMAARFLVSRKEKAAPPLPASAELCATVTGLLAIPQVVDVENPLVAQGILKGFAELRFSVVADEVVGSLSVVGVLAGFGTPPIGPREGGLVSASEVEWALRLLMRCWRYAFVDGMQDGIRIASRRLTPGLRTWGLGYLHWRNTPPQPAQSDRATMMAATLTGRYYSETEVETLYVDGTCLVYESGPLAGLQPIASQYEGLNALAAPATRVVVGSGGMTLTLIGGMAAFTRVDFHYSALPSRQPISVYVYPPKYLTPAMKAASYLLGSTQADPSDTLWMD